MPPTPKRTPKRWLFHGILTDTPISEEDTYYDAAHISSLLRVQHFPGIKITTLRVQELPERPKKPGQKPQKPSETGP